MKARTFVVLFVLFSAFSASAGIETYTGSETWLWENHAVVYGEITDVVLDKQGRNLADIKLDVQTTLTGSLDAAHRATISVPVDFSIRSTAVDEAPRAKTKVVVFLEKLKNGDYAVERSRATFMPRASPLVVVKDFEDAKVKFVISRLRRH